MLVINEAASFLWVRNFLRYNQPESPNSVKAWISALDLIPECDERRELLVAAYEYLQGCSPKFREALTEAVIERFNQGTPHASSFAIPDPGEGAEAGAREGAEKKHSDFQIFPNRAIDPEEYVNGFIPNCPPV